MLGNVACISEKRISYGILVEKSEGKRSHAKMRIDGRVILKLILKK